MIELIIRPELKWFFLHPTTTTPIGACVPVSCTRIPECRVNGAEWAERESRGLVPAHFKTLRQCESGQCGWEEESFISSSACVIYRERERERKASGSGGQSSSSA